MKTAQFYKLRELVELRKRLAYAHLQSAHRSVVQGKDDVEAALHRHQEIQVSGREKITNFLSGDYNYTGSYPSRLSGLRALTAKVDHETREAKAKLEMAEQNLREAELSVLKKQKEYYAAIQKMEKINFLSKRFTENELRHQNNIQEIDRLEGGLKSEQNDVVR